MADDRGDVNESSALLNKTTGNELKYVTNRETQNESPEQMIRRKARTMKVIYFNVFIGSVSYSIVISSLWPFLQQIDGTVHETFLGWVNAGFSCSQMLTSFVMGYWSEKRRAIEPLIVSRIFLAAGSLLYSYAQAFGKQGIWVILGARVMLGVASGSVAVTRAVGAQLSTNEERAKTMGFIALWQALGFFFGPAIQAAVKPVGSKGVYYGPLRLYLNVYTAPGYFLVILCVINIFLLFFYFNDEISDSKTKFKQQRKEMFRQSSTYEPMDFPIVFVCLVLWFVTMTAFSLNETIMTPLVMNEYGWTRSKTVFNTSIILSVAGLLSMCVFISVGPLTKRFGERILSLCGYLIMLSSFIIYLPWGPGYPKLKMADISKNVTTSLSHNTTHHLSNIVGKVLLHSSLDDDDGGGGCPYEYKWCYTTPSLSMPQFIVGSIFMAIGYPLCAVIISTLFSKVLGPFPQGRYMGIFSSIGGLARMVGPLYVTAIYQNYGIRWTATSVNCILLVTIILVAVCWRRLVPYSQRKRQHLTLVTE